MSDVGKNAGGKVGIGTRTAGKNAAKLGSGL